MRTQMFETIAVSFWQLSARLYVHCSTHQQRFSQTAHSWSKP